MAQVVLGEQQSILPIEVSAEGLFELLIQGLLLKQLLPHPQRNRHLERTQSGRGEGEIGFDQPLELQEGFVVENDIVQIVEMDSGFRQAVRHRVAGKTGVVFFPAEALFLSSRYHLAVFHQGRGAIVVKSRNSEDAHQYLEQRVDKGRDGGGLRQDQEPAE